MDDPYAVIGRKQVELEGLHREYDALLNVLGDVASGYIAPSRVTVDRTARTWTLSPPPDSNGVVADPLHLVTDTQGRS